MMATTALDASGEEDTMTWFTPILKNWIAFTYLGKYLSYGIYALWSLVPLMLLYSIVLGIYGYLCLVNLLLYIYKKKNNLEGDMSSKSWDKAKEVVLHHISSIGKIWHGYEIIGMEHLPEGPGLIIYYHGPIAIDYVCFTATLYQQTGRTCHSVCDHVLCLIPDFSKAECVELLKAGKLVGIPPGGLREVNFSDNNYSLIWGNRTGFAQVALEAKVPIIPMFTQNIRDAYWTVGNTWLTRWLYERTRWLILPIHGGFPVKLRTYIGEPIPYDLNMTAKELAEKVSELHTQKYQSKTKFCIYQFLGKDKFTL
ncbi:hypothetical protein lerEdw1_012586 [Lerista edwardsae]|nr:hypothetical protein lerEdw1_012586 [Lerista edwardsae]